MHNLVSMIVTYIDNEIAKVGGASVGGKFSYDLYTALVAQKHIQDNPHFAVNGSGAFPITLPAYKIKHYATIDTTFPYLSFEVGTP